MEILVHDINTPTNKLFKRYKKSRQAAILLTGERKGPAPPQIINGDLWQSISKTFAERMKTPTSRGTNKKTSTNRSQPDRAQKRMRSGQTYYPPTVEDDPAEQGDTPSMRRSCSVSSGNSFGEETPSTKRRKTEQVDRVSPTPVASGSPIAEKTELPGKQPQSKWTPFDSHPTGQSSAGISGGFTPINTPKPKSFVANPSPTLLSSKMSDVDQELPYNAQSKLRAIFLSGDKTLSIKTLQAAAGMIAKLERDVLIPNGLLQDSCLEKTLKEIVALDAIPGDTGFHFRKRMEKLLQTWSAWTRDDVVFARGAVDDSPTAAITSKKRKAKESVDQAPRTVNNAVADSTKGTNTTTDKETPSLPDRTQRSREPSPLLELEDLLNSPIERRSPKGKQRAVEALTPEHSPSSSKTPAKPFDASTPSKASNRSLKTPQSILKTPSKRKAGQASAVGSASAASPTRHAITSIDLTSYDPDGKPERLLKQNDTQSKAKLSTSSPYSSTAAKDNPNKGPENKAEFLEAFDPAGLLKERRELLEKQRAEVELDLDLMDDIQRELDAVRQERERLRDESRKEMDRLRRAMEEQDRMEVQISRRLREMQGGQ